MTELDKKLQKSQTDLVQAVFEAQERKNLERVDMLVTNAIKQLKMSRFKPDQTICISLTYLAKVNPRVFSQSNAIKDVLKSLLRRDGGPTNIKGKNDTILPILAANILLASCDSSDIRIIILSKIEQWLNSQNQKVTELIQHLLATLCMKCKSDQSTISPLIVMRQHWLNYLDENFSIYGSAPIGLCLGIRKLFREETNCNSMVAYLKFLAKHDNDIEGLSQDVAGFILLKPITLASMQKDGEHGNQLNKLILTIFIRLFNHLRETAQKATSMDGIDVSQVKKELKSEIKQEVGQNKLKTAIKIETDSKGETTSEESSEANDQVFKNINIYIKLPNGSDIIKLNTSTMEAVLTLLSTVDVEVCFENEFDELLSFWLVKDGTCENMAKMYADFSLSTPHNIHIDIRQKLIRSSNDLLVELGLENADPDQLVNLVQRFGSPLTSLNQILKKLESVQDVEQLKSNIADPFYFNQLVEFYSNQLGAKKAKELKQRLESVQ